MTVKKMSKVKRFISFEENLNIGRGDGLIEFLETFDPIIAKYDVSRNRELKLNYAQYAEAERYDFSQQFGHLNKNHYSDILKNLKQVYDDERIIESDVKVFHYVEKNIIHRYFGIPLLDKMFDEDYFEFEWDMHVKQDFNDHNTGWYRDHFIHQIRNFRMMYSLLKDFGFEQAIRSVFECRIGHNAVAKYVREKHSEFIYNRQSPLFAALDDIVEKNGTWKTYFDKNKEGRREYYDDYFYSYVILASSALAALFHDMGYPICHFLTVRQRVSSYNPTMYMFTHNAIDSFDQLASKLSSSLLFNVVPPRIIQDRLRYNVEKKSYDHGVYSAVAFLLQFYDNGLIFSLSPEKQCAIEMAALAIYNHTEKFRSMDEIKYKKQRYQTVVFKQNPIAFLLRFCDDLQEWDRQYFEISKASDLLFCEKCGTPLLNFPKDTKKQRLREYGCYCGKNRNNMMLRPDIFIKRKLYLVCVANSVSFKQTEEPRQFEVEIDYDYYKLLLLSQINPTYAIHRDSENGDVGKLLQNQNFRIQSMEKLAFSEIKINYFVTANPLLIKIKILEEYLKYNKFKMTGETSAVFAEQLIKDVFGGHIPDYYNLNSNPKIVKIIDFYRELLKARQSHTDSSTFIKGMKGMSDEPLYSSIMKSLISNCFGEINCKSILTDINKYTDPERPFNEYKPIPKKVKKNEERKENPSFKTEPFYIGFYQDILLFYWMNERIKEGKKNERQKEIEE